MRYPSAALVVLCVFGAPASAQEPASQLPPELETYIANALRDWDVPGAALAVVKDGKVVVAKGYGVRELGKPERVDERTIFDSASLTKAFTSAAIATLVDEKKVTWDEPVRTYLPKIAFRDPYLTENVTLRDLLSHRLGSRNNSAWYFGNLTADQLIGIYKHLEQQTPFRTRWTYSNVGYQLAAEVAKGASGIGWEQLVTDRLLKPLGMDCSIVNFDRVPSTGNYASPHAEMAGVHQAIERETTRMSTPAAGGVQMCAKDMATWLLFQLGDGTHAGKRILSTEALQETHAPQIIVPTTPTFRKARQIDLSATYAFGWNVWDYRGELLLWHTGGGDGQSAYMALLPDRGLGVSVVVNTWKTGGSAFPLMLGNRIQDHYLGREARDYLVEYRTSWEKERKSKADERAALQQARVKKSSPTVPLERYAGLYRDKLGLEVKVTLEGKTLALQYVNSERAPLEHWHGDTFRVMWERKFAVREREAFVTFRVGEDAKAGALRFEVFRESVEAEREDSRE